MVHTKSLFCVGHVLAEQILSNIIWTLLTPTTVPLLLPSFMIFFHFYSLQNIHVYLVTALSLISGYQSIGILIRISLCGFCMSSHQYRQFLSFLQSFQMILWHAFYYKFFLVTVDHFYLHRCWKNPAYSVMYKSFGILMEIPIMNNNKS